MTARCLAALAALILSSADLSAQQATIYGPDGRVQQRVTTGSNGAQTIYGADGRVQGRTSTGSTGTITVYGPDGRVRSTITPGRSHAR